MAENQGTHVMAKIVTPDSEDTFATHDANTCEGGFHQVATEQEMLDITTERRKAGMECRVTDDPVPDKNGRYVLQNDLVTWIKESNDLVLGSPPDAGWGKGISTLHALTGFGTGNTFEEFADHIATYLDCTAPQGPPALGTLLIGIPNFYSANQQGLASHTQVDNIQINIQPIGTLNGPFGDSKAGTVRALVDATEEGSRVLVAGNPGDDDGVYGALTLSAEEEFNGIFQQILAAIQAPSPLALNNVQHTYRLEHDAEFTEIIFFIDDPVQPSISNEVVAGQHLSGVGFVSGIPTLKVGDSLKTTFDTGNVVSWYYNLQKISRIESPYTNNLDVPLPAGPLNRGANISFTDVITNVLNGVYTEDASVTIFAYNSRALTPEEQGSDISSQGASGTNPIRIDTVSDESITVTSGQGQFPTVGGGGAGQPFNTSQDLRTAGNEELMMLNGVVSYPFGNYTNNAPTPGPDYGSVPAGSYNGIRWRTYDLGNISNQNSVTFQILNTVFFNGTPLETGTYELQLQVEGDTGWLDANAAYPGAGNPVNDGDPALDVAQSTQSTKRVTFGTQPRSGRVLVRIGWDASENNRGFTRIQ